MIEAHSILHPSTPRPTTAVSTGTVIHHTPQAPKKPLAKAHEFLKPTVYKPEGDDTPSTSKRILDALSVAGLRKAPKATMPKKKSYPPPRKLAVSVVDGKSGATIRADVPVYRLMDRSNRAKDFLESNTRAAKYKVYGTYKPAAMCGVLESIVWLQPIPICSTIPMINMFTYEACLRLGISNERVEMKPLLTAMYKDLSNGPITNDLLAFVTNHLGPKDPVFKHTANVLCHQRFTKSVSDEKEFARMVAKKPAMQKAMVHIDQAHKARREAFKARKQARSGNHVDAEVSGESGSDDEKTVEVKTVKTMLEDITQKKESDDKQKEKLLDLFKNNSTPNEAKDETKIEEVEKTDKTAKLE